MTESREMSLEEAIKAVVEIGLRYETQLELAAAAARADRQREILREAAATGAGR